MENSNELFLETYIRPCDHGFSDDCDSSDQESLKCNQFLEQNEKEKYKEYFRGLTANERYCFFESCSRRNQNESCCGFHVDYVLPFFGEHLIVCLQYLCHVLQIPTHIPQWHNERVWNSSLSLLPKVMYCSSKDNERKSYEKLHSTQSKKNQYIKQLPKVFEDFDALHNTILCNPVKTKTMKSNYISPRRRKLEDQISKRNDSFILPKLNLDDIKYPKLQGLDQHESESDREFVDLFTLFTGGDKVKKPKLPADDSSEEEVQIEFDRNDLGPYFKWVQDLQQMTSRLDTMGESLSTARSKNDENDEYAFSSGDEGASELNNLAKEAEESVAFVDVLINDLKFDETENLLNEVEEVLRHTQCLKTLDLDYLDEVRIARAQDAALTLGGINEAIEGKYSKDKLKLESFMESIKGRQELNLRKHMKFKSDAAALGNILEHDKINDSQLENYSKVELQLLVTVLNEKLRGSGSFLSFLFGDRELDDELLQMLMEKNEIKTIQTQLQHLCSGAGTLQTKESKINNALIAENDELLLQVESLELDLKKANSNWCQSKIQIKKLESQIEKMEEKLTDDMICNIPEHENQSNVIQKLKKQLLENHQANESESFNSNDKQQFIKQIEILKNDCSELEMQLKNAKNLLKESKKISHVQHRDHEIQTEEKPKIQTEAKPKVVTFDTQNINDTHCHKLFCCPGSMISIHMKAQALPEYDDTELEEYKRKNQILEEELMNLRQQSRVEEVVKEHIRLGTPKQQEHETEIQLRTKIASLTKLLHHSHTTTSHLKQDIEWWQHRYEGLKNQMKTNKNSLIQSSSRSSERNSSSEKTHRLASRASKLKSKIKMLGQMAFRYRKSSINKQSVGGEGTGDIPPDEPGVEKFISDLQDKVLHHEKLSNNSIQQLNTLLGNQARMVSQVQRLLMKSKALDTIVIPELKIKGEFDLRTTTIGDPKSLMGSMKFNGLNKRILRTKPRRKRRSRHSQKKLTVKRFSFIDEIRKQKPNGRLKRGRRKHARVQKHKMGNTKRRANKVGNLEFNGLQFGR